MLSILFKLSNGNYDRIFTDPISVGFPNLEIDEIIEIVHSDYDYLLEFYLQRKSRGTVIFGNKTKDNAMIKRLNKHHQEVNTNTINVNFPLFNSIRLIEKCLLNELELSLCNRIIERYFYVKDGLDEDTLIAMLKQHTYPVIQKILINPIKNTKQRKLRHDTRDNLSTDWLIEKYPWVFKSILHNLEKSVNNRLLKNSKSTTAKIE